MAGDLPDLSENAARVAAGEGFTEAWNIARFFAHKVRVGRGDVLVVDEASQVSTKDLARIFSYALQAGAQVIGVGDTRQLARGGGRRPARLSPPVRALEADRGPPVRAGVGAGRVGPDRRRRRDGAGRVRRPRPDLDGPQDRVYDDAVDLYMTDVAWGKQALLLAGSNEEAARLARLVRGRGSSGARSVASARSRSGTATRPGPVTWCGPG